MIIQRRANKHTLSHNHDFVLPSDNILVAREFKCRSFSPTLIAAADIRTFDSSRMRPRYGEVEQEVVALAVRLIVVSLDRRRMTKDTASLLPSSNQPPRRNNYNIHGVTFSTAICYLFTVARWLNERQTTRQEG